MAESKNVESDIIPKIATGFCSGMAQTCNICGAVSGAIMAISLFSGRSAADEDINPNYVMVRELTDRFEKEFGTINCSKLLGCDLNTPEGQSFFIEKNLMEKCSIYTQKATKIAMSIIESRQL